jgi:hypothetical protein
MNPWDTWTGVLVASYGSTYVATLSVYKRDERSKTGWFVMGQWKARYFKVLR